MKIIPDIVGDKSLKKVVQFVRSKDEAHVSKWLHFYLRTLPVDQWDSFFERHDVTFEVID